MPTGHLRHGLNIIYYGLKKLCMPLYDNHNFKYMQLSVYVFVSIFKLISVEGTPSLLVCSKK